MSARRTARLLAAAALAAALAIVTPTAATASRVPLTGPVVATERVVSGTMDSGGYPGAAPAPGGCTRGHYDANYSETALAREPGSDRLVGAAKAFFGAYSTYKAQHTAAFTIGRTGSGTHPVGGFDCVTTGSQAMPPSWTNVTDPNLEWDTRGRVQQVVLAYNAYWGTVQRPNGNIYSTYSDDAGATWITGNGGRPVQAGPDPSTASSNFLDKPWVTVQQDRSSPLRDHVYAAWVEFPADSADPVLIHTAVSRNRGATWSAPLTVPQPVPTIGANPWPQIAAGAGGSLSLSYVTYGAGNRATLWSARSADDGRSWTGTREVAGTAVLRSCCLPGTTVHDGAVGSLSASRTTPGHLYLTWEEYAAGRLRVRLSWSTDGGASWSPARTVGDAAGTDQFQPSVAAGPDGAVVVAFYDKRWRCPQDPAVTLANRGRINTCIGVTVQAYRDTGADTGWTLRPVGGDRRVSTYLWDPDQPAQLRRGLPQHACEDPTPDCNDYFLGDYLDLEVGSRSVYVLSTSTHYPGPLTRADDGGPIYYERAVLHAVDLADLGLTTS